MVMTFELYLWCRREKKMQPHYITYVYKGVDAGLFSTNEVEFACAVCGARKNDFN